MTKYFLLHEHHILEDPNIERYKKNGLKNFEGNLLLFDYYDMAEIFGNIYFPKRNYPGTNHQIRTFLIFSFKTDL